MSGKKKGLGRGLSALFGDEKPKDKPNEINQTNTVSISDLSRNPYQPRQHFSEEKLEELANSIKKNGIIQPIAVRPNKNEKGKYEIIAGERRWLAAQKAGLHEIPVRILDLSDVESLEVAIVENIQRDDLNPVEEARGYQRLNQEFEGRFKVMLVPNITNICYGRGVGYKIEEIELSKEIQEISATKIRAKMREEGKLK